MAHEDIKYEQACILYNLGKLLDFFFPPLALQALPAQGLSSLGQMAKKRIVE